MTTLTIDDLNKILGFIDLATKAGGYAVAEQAFPLVEKMKQMAQETPGPAPVEGETEMQPS